MEEYVWVSKLASHPVFASRAHPVLKRLAARHGVQVTIAGPTDTQSGPYVEAVRAAVGHQAAGIMVIGWPDAGIAQAIDEAVDSGIPVVTVDCDVPHSKRLAHVGTDWHRMGQVMAEHLAALIAQRGKVLALSMAGMANMEAGLHGFRSRLAEYPHVEMLGPADDLAVGPERAEAVVSEYLRQHPDLAGIAGFDGNSGPGAAAALEKAGRARAVRLVCVDADAPHRAFLRKGVIDAAFCQRREAFTYVAFRTLYAYHHGSEVSGGLPGLINIPGNIDTGFLVVTPANVDTFESELRLDDALRHHELSHQVTLLSEIMDSVAAIVLATDQTGRIIYVSPATERLTGHARGDLLRLPVEALLEPPGSGGALMRLLRGAEAETFEGVARRRDGSSFPVQIQASALKTGPHVRGAVIAAVDISERKRAEGALRESEERFRNLAENIPGVAIQGYRPDGTVFYWNAGSTTVYGYTPEEAVGRNLGDLIIPADIKPLFLKGLQVGRQATRSGEFMPATECDLLHKSGQLVPVYSVHTAVVIPGKEPMLFCIDIDLSERKRAEEALRHSEARFRELAELLPEIVFETDTRGVLTFVNRKAFEATGYTPADFDRGFEAANLLVPAHRPAARDRIGQVLRGEDLNRPNEYTAQRKDGTTFEIIVRSVPVLQNGVVVGLRGIATDITERLRLDEHLRQVTKMEAVGRLAGGVAHDFNNLLTGIIGYSGILQQQMSADDPRRTTLRHITAEAERAAALTRQLLAFSRKQMLQVVVLDLNAIIRDLGRMLERLIGEDVHLVMNLAAGLDPVEADPSQIEQVLMNLAVNARDAMPTGGTLRIETANVTVDEEQARTQPDAQPGAYVVLTVSDTGQGMDAETCGRLFEPFFTTKEKGTGLGLSTVYGIVKQHRGWVSVSSAPGEGATFSVYLPRAAARPDDRRPPTAAQPLRHGGETVLVVEDEDIVRRLACDILRLHRYAVLDAPTPAAAIRRVRQHRGPIHLLLTDVVLPQMDGRRLYQQLARARQDLRVLYMSGYAEEVIGRHGVLDPDVPFLQKPFTSEALARKVREVLDGPVARAPKGSTAPRV